MLQGGGAVQCKEAPPRSARRHFCPQWLRGCGRAVHFAVPAGAEPQTQIRRAASQIMTTSRSRRQRGLSIDCTCTGSLLQ